MLHENEGEREEGGRGTRAFETKANKSQPHSGAMRSLYARTSRPFEERAYFAMQVGYPRGWPKITSIRVYSVAEHPVNHTVLFSVTP